MPLWRRRHPCPALWPAQTAFVWSAGLAVHASDSTSLEAADRRQASGDCSRSGGDRISAGTVYRLRSAAAMVRGVILLPHDGLAANAARAVKSIAHWGLSSSATDFRRHFLKAPPMPLSRVLFGGKPCQRSAAGGTKNPACATGAGWPLDCRKAQLLPSSWERALPEVGSGGAGSPKLGDRANLGVFPRSPRRFSCPRQPDGSQPQRRPSP